MGRLVQLKNNTGVDGVWGGRSINAGEIFTFSDDANLEVFENDTQTNSDVWSSRLIVGNGTLWFSPDLGFKWLHGDVPVDGDGSPLSRVKLAPAGWTFQDHSFEFTTAKLNSVYNKKADGTDWNFCVLKFYELVNNVETLITGDNASDQSYITANCIKTIIDWEPTHDYDIIQGRINLAQDVNADIRVWGIAVPDVPALYGGSKELITGGMNMKYHKAYTFDGRVVKHMVYSPVYHSNKIRIIIRHDVGYQAIIEGCVDFYKA